MEVSRRIQTIVGEIAYKKLADIGSDHGYIPIYACLSQGVEKAVACDINRGPLGRARENIKAYGLEGKVETRLANGLLALSPGEVDTIVIAGIGGDLAMDILRKGRDVAVRTKQLIVQPQSEIKTVREYIHVMDFKIDNEEMILEDGQFYTILNCRPGAEDGYTEFEYEVGKKLIQKKSPVLAVYLEAEIEKLAQILNQLGLVSIENEKNRRRKIELEQRLKMYREVLTWL